MGVSLSRDSRKVAHLRIPLTEYYKSSVLEALPLLVFAKFEGSIRARAVLDVNLTANIFEYRAP